jgi:hypothetical protein
MDSVDHVAKWAGLDGDENGTPALFNHFKKMGFLNLPA